ncbi:MAG: CPBP family intramembrane metalloprotease [Microcoleus sp. SIO2G3]|nr:CPBP family intramembrane metalloprotease [Microcoleus sp. SIO2G3]
MFANLTVIHVVRDRIYAAISTIPETEAWLQTVGLLILFTLVALPLGFFSGFLQVEVLKTSWKTVLGIIATSLITPAVTEELFFRVLFLPQTTESVSISKLWLWGIISLVMFIVYHPLNALSFFSQGLETFFNSAFLLLATLLGITCSLAYLHSGSLWTPVVIHWLAVVVWLLFLGGYRKLYTVVQK